MVTEPLRAEFAGKNVAVLGAGIEGLAMVQFLIRQGARVELRDQKTASELQYQLFQLQGLEYSLCLGPDYLQGLDECDIIVRSPGIPWLTHELEHARRAGAVVTSQTDIFIRHCSSKVIGVTGTKGKSTTAALVVHILQHAQQKIRFGGNVGEPIIHWLDDLTLNEYVILELSSFQLQGLSVSPHVAVVLDIGVEHLDYHRTIDEYVEAKRSIVTHQKVGDVAVIDSDSLSAATYAASSVADVWWFSRKHFVDRGVYVKEIGGEQWFEGRTDETESLIAPVRDMVLNGDHFLSNVAAAAAVCLALKIDVESIREAVRSFQGLDHRMQSIGQFAGRLWIDDGYATAPDACIAALEACREMSLVLIVGGSSKGYGFDTLAQAILDVQPNAVVCIGETGPMITRTTKLLAQKRHAPLPHFVDGGNTMSTIVRQAIAVSKSGDTILFSPACASFGLFVNAQDRATQFVAAVKSFKGRTHAIT